MESIRIIVPRNIIKNHYPHPEMYGESIVELSNGMTTDVYTSKRGQLYTITNDESLISYLKKHTTNDLYLTIHFSNFELKTLSFKDQKWLRRMRNKLFYKESKYLVSLFISHSLTMNSQAFLIRFNKKKIGIITYKIINDVSVVSLQLFYRDCIKQQHILELYSIVMDYIQYHYKINIFYDSCLELDSLHNNF